MSLMSMLLNEAFQISYEGSLFDYLDMGNIADLTGNAVHACERICAWAWRWVLAMRRLAGAR